MRKYLIGAIVGTILAYGGWWAGTAVTHRIQAGAAAFVWLASPISPDSKVMRADVLDLLVREEAAKRGIK